MSRFADTLYAVAITLWVGALWAIGYISAPTLFEYVVDRSFAGVLAGRQFAIVAWVGIICAVYALIYQFFREGLGAFRLLAFWLIVLMLVLTLIGHFGVTPVIERLRPELARDVMASVVRSRFATWHGIASVLWLIQSVLGVGLVSLLIRR
ncbi:MAG: hypothetical protein CGU28_13700 [Candidatus Dactylopiibacterium carminicum]|uniref:DUF4149 domain-containing protein n=1 Tax=Candidatus Dactylopiibacterium carminicum TaxID=857335 RepID=A0A272EP23_9RHOO|nr:DUF4149 domain-containing protein [Candidatus Dactylopiibacterium carminicum]KAF7598201.1 DUF4149 domain-containing protein [Candidatus Dactylopiibacterium carminicum]PAS91853.1 MAG: hypothetical protein CGU29_14240 [Candidatus Dactylopiibacterium carminicum]PAS94624.1 MAG: hypothetical protein CGU28_13700 [Candidatus Dactylopiibacterium carminicum]PAS96919.1 MAG: hypothetical protein BSR46_14665 [Candidatus Dactylopiibacterium carminicum]